MRPLSYRQRLFVEYYLGESKGCAVDAARRAGYGTPHPEGVAVTPPPYPTSSFEGLTKFQTARQWIPQAGIARRLGVSPRVSQRLVACG